MEFELLKRIVEAALLAAPQPLTVSQLIDLFAEGEAPPADEIRRALHGLQQDCEGRGVELLEVASGFRYQVRAEVYPHIARLWSEKPARYSRALLETLVLIAYRQPITRGEIESIRGVAVNTQIIRTLEEREWIRVVGHRDVPGKPALFGTTRAFLDYFNLKSLDQLPPLSALQELPDLEPEFDFDGARAAQAGVPAALVQAESGTAEIASGDTPAEETAEDRAPSEGDGEQPEPREAANSDVEPDSSAEDARDSSDESQEHAEAELPAEASNDPAAETVDSPTGEPETSPEQMP